MSPQQMIRAIRALEARINALEAKNVPEPIAIKTKRAYTRKNPNAERAPECQDLPTKS